MTQNGYAESRQRAQRLIESGSVTVDGRVIRKSSESIDEGEHSVTVTDSMRYVGRGGYKLEGALQAFSIDVTGLFALDIGASTGGFTDCLLQNGADRVIAVDAGAGQLAGKLLQDARVTSYEHLNARELTPEMIGGARVDLIVMDVSFISASYILPRFPALLREGGRAIVLIKPQFEVGRSMVGKGGIVKDPRAHREAIERVLQAGEAADLTPIALAPSPVMGGDGNREFLVCFIKGSSSQQKISSEEICRAVKTAVGKGKERGQC